MKVQDMLMFQPLRTVALAGMLVLLVTLPATARASRVRDLSLTEMAGKAGSIFAGRVSGTTATTVRGLPVTRVTFEVGDGVKGAPGKSITLTMLGGERPGGLPYRVPGMPQFRAGEEWILLAYPPSEAGLTSPVGLFQGAFRVSTGAAGNRMVAGQGIAADTTLPYTTFMQNLRDLVTGVTPAAGAGGPAAATTDLEAAAAARGAVRRP